MLRFLEIYLVLDKPAVNHIAGWGNFLYITSKKLSFLTILFLRTLLMSWAETGTYVRSRMSDLSRRKLSEHLHLLVMPRWRRNQIPLLLSYYFFHQTCHFLFSKGKHFIISLKHLKSLGECFPINKFDYKSYVGQADIKNKKIKIWYLNQV